MVRYCENMEAYPFKIGKGWPEPFGSSKRGDGINFAVVSKHARELSLCLFAEPFRIQPDYEITLNPDNNRTGDVWHILIDQLPVQYFYLFRIDGASYLTLDPYAKEIFTSNIWGKGDQPYLPVGGIDSDESFSWEEDKCLEIPLEELIIYEMHVRGFTQHTSSGVSHPGTYLGVIEKIPHLLALGVNAIELMPIHEFNETEYKKRGPGTGEQLYNYWGYSTVNFFSPMQRYVFGAQRGDAIHEFKTMVKACHQHGIEVILDVVYNHTAEGGKKGPVLSFKELDNSIYYMLDPNGDYLNFSGCGNTFNCNHPIVRELILRSLRYWVVEMHIDGFRFDLASILARDIQGHPMAKSPLLDAISQDPILSKTKLISEPWDAGGMYQVGSFCLEAKNWSEWNGKYRDIVRRFIKGTGTKGEFATKICGSQDLYYRFAPCRSVNFIIAHDGFTLADLVSYNHKHNLANGEDNRDGTNDNDSWNCGVEGHTRKQKVLNLRARQMRNYHLALMVSRGIPMLLMGDEYGHSKHGNNNTWCHDNELNWFLWNQLDENQEFYRFYQKLIHFRREHSLLRQNEFLSSNDIEWHGAHLHHPLWNIENQFIAFTLKGHQAGNDLYVAFNASHNVVTVHFPPNEAYKTWHWVVNTASVSPYDFRDDTNLATTMVSPSYHMHPYSALMLRAVVL